LAKSISEGWIGRDGAMASTRSGRGVIYSTRDYARFRLIFTMRHVSGKPDHQACVVIFCTRPQPDEKPLDALGGIQFQVPNGATDFHDLNAGKIGPIALQMHNAGLSMSTKISLSKSIPRMTNSSAQSCRLARRGWLSEHP
jgi:hypothetical protein